MYTQHVFSRNRLTPGSRNTEKTPISTARAEEDGSPTTVSYEVNQLAFFFCLFSSTTGTGPRVRRWGCNIIQRDDFISKDKQIFIFICLHYLEQKQRSRSRWRSFFFFYGPGSVLFPKLITGRNNFEHNII